ncbi:histidine phosphatase family protein [Chloroflexi bacterium TSY]|nr:histidine phosphatase family protein [Chloroflexi bacterium TSY]
MTITYLLLIRHGENDWVGSNRLAGRTPNVHLNERGRQQAQELAKMLAEQTIHALYSSPLERCVETAQPVADALNLPFQIEEGVLEADIGDWEGKKLSDLAKLPEWSMVQHHPATFCFPNGETMRSMQFRAVSALERIQQRHPNQTVAVFSHADIIRTCMAHYLGVPLDLFQRIIISTASVSAIAFYEQRPSVLFVNQMRRLPKFEIRAK